MLNYLYIALVLTLHPTILSDLKALGDDRFKVREAATNRLKALPCWTSSFFKYYARKATDPEVRRRCDTVHETLNVRKTYILGALNREWRLSKDRATLRNDLETLRALEKKMAQEKQSDSKK